MLSRPHKITHTLSGGCPIYKNNRYNNYYYSISSKFSELHCAEMNKMGVAQESDSPTPSTNITTCPAAKSSSRTFKGNMLFSAVCATRCNLRPDYLERGCAILYTQRTLRSRRLTRYLCTLKCLKLTGQLKRASSLISLSPQKTGAALSSRFFYGTGSL